MHRNTGNTIKHFRRRILFLLIAAFILGRFPSGAAEAKTAENAKSANSAGRVIREGWKLEKIEYGAGSDGTDAYTAVCPVFSASLNLRKTYLFMLLASVKRPFFI